MKRLLLLLVLTLPGCDRPVDKRVSTFDGVKVVVLQPGARHQWETVSNEKRISEKDTVSGFEYALEPIGREEWTLRVAKKSYGTVRSNDMVEIEGGLVTVNGTSRSPAQ
jgi:hypothetical protein